MGIVNVILEDEHGKPIDMIEGPTHVLDRFLPPADEKSYQCLRFIDPYGDTVFNRLQMDQFVLEWERIADQARTEQEKALVERVLRLARKCQSKPHLYLKFYGD